MSCPQDAAAYSPVREGQCYWSRIVQSEFSRSERDNAIAQNGSETQFSGGAQFIVSDAGRLGFAAGYHRTEGSARDDAAFEGDTGHIGLVYKHQVDQWLGAAAIYGGYGENAYTRVVNTPVFAGVGNGEQEHGYVSLRLRGTFVQEFGGFFVKPVVDLDLSALHTFSIRESGLGAFNARADDHTEFMFTATPALEFGQQFRLDNGGVVRATARAGAAIRNDPELSMPFSLQGAPDSVPDFVVTDSYDKVVGIAGFGLEMIATDGLVLGLKYEGQFGETTEVHSGSVKFSVGF